MSWWSKLIEAIKKWWDKKNPDPKPDPEPDPGFKEDEIDLNEIQWLGVNVGGWKITCDLNVSFSGGLIVYDQIGTTKWPSKHEAGVDATGNPWVIAKIGGKWMAATHEWMRRGQKNKNKRSVHGDHIKRNEFGPDWQPKSGETYGFCVSGLCRGSQRNVSERTQIALVKWP